MKTVNTTFASVSWPFMNGIIFAVFDAFYAGEKYVLLFATVFGRESVSLKFRVYCSGLSGKSDVEAHCSTSLNVSFCFLHIVDHSLIGRPCF